MSRIIDIFRNSSKNLRQKEDIEYIRNRTLAKFPLLGATMARVETVFAEKVGREEVNTAGTNGKTIYISPSYFDSLSDDEQVFVYAHELFHVAFNHILRSANRNHKLWNIATDSVINQMLKSEGLPMADGGVDIAEAIQFSAEEMYEKLLKEKEEEKQNQQQKQSEQGNQSESDGGDADDDENEQAGHDNHEIWKEAIKQNEKQEKEKQGKKSKQENQEQKSDNNQVAAAESDFDAGQENPPAEENTSPDERQFDDWNPSNESEFEKGFEIHNRQKRAIAAQQAQKQLNAEKNHAMSHAVAESMSSFGNVGKSNAVLDWKKVLKKTLESEHDRWSYRRSDSDNDYMARVEEIDEEDKGETEVLLDTSGSVSDEFLREFLRQLKPLLKNSKLRVGCFDHRFHPFTDIKSEKDIDSFRIPDKGNTDWDLAVKSFTRKKHVNKIIFTDGETPGKMPDYSTKNINVIWLVYGDETFNPVCGRVIRVNAKQIGQNYLDKNSINNSFSYTR